MAKNELLPFADGEDANVLPTNQWEALTDILENGFQSGIARSEQVNRVLAQGAVASYVLGQLIVDQLNKDATLDKSALYQNLILALQENAKDACLPLSGGTMTGAIKFPNGSSIYQNDNTNWKTLEVNGNGANLHLRGTGSPKNPNSFGVDLTDGSTTKTFYGSIDGSLKWDNKNVVCVEPWQSGANWYRKYSDGWIEQGGFFESSGTAVRTVTLHTSMSSKNYSVFATIGGSTTERTLTVTNKTTTTVSISVESSGDTTGNASGNFYWYACGY